MNINELNSFKMSDAVQMHDILNPSLFNDDHLKNDVREKLLEIAEEFIDDLGINGLNVTDIVMSGSNAAYSYTPHSDIDLHIITDMKKLPNDSIYQELFTAKKNLFNANHSIRIKNYDVEVYVQDSNKPVRTLGEYSILNDKWNKLPSKRRANFDQSAVEHKFDKLVHLSELALRSDDMTTLGDLLGTIKRYRQAGLDEHGEFGPENLAFKALRTHGIVDKLYDHMNELKSRQLSLDEMIAEQREPMVWLKGKLSGSYTDKQLKELGAKLYNGQWAMPKTRFDTLVRLGQLRESADTNVTRLKDLARVSTNMPDADFWIIRKGSDKTVGTPVKEFNPERIGIKIVRTDVLDPQYLYYTMMHLHNQGYFAKVAVGTLKLVNIKVADVANISFGRRDVDEDYDPNGRPPGPEFPPTMPRGTVKVDVSDVYDWYKLGQHISNLKGLGKHDFGKGPPSTIISFGDEDTEHKYIKDLEKTGLSTTDIDPSDPKQPKNMKRQKVDPTYNVAEASPFPKSNDYIADELDKLQRYCEQNNMMNTAEYAKAYSMSFRESMKLGVQMFFWMRNENYYMYKSINKNLKIVGDKIDLTKFVKKELARKNSRIIEASGYIPSEAEKNDPRFKTALTVDIHPNTMKQNAKKLGSKISRAGIPPILKPSGKI